MNHIKTLGIDLAKNVFQLHGIDAKAKTLLRKRLTRTQLIEFVSQLSPCTIAIEACTGSHYWARLFQNAGHTVKMMAPQFVKPYVKSNKSDRNDAEAIAEAATRPSMRFVAMKTQEQQDILALHKVRQLIVKERTAQANQIRGLLAEYGIIIPKGISHIHRLLVILDENKEKLSVLGREIFRGLYEKFKTVDAQEKQYKEKIEQLTMQNPVCRILMKIKGVGALTASAILAKIGNINVFKNGRELSAYVGLVPTQHSSGDKIRLGGISKRGDRYLRTLLIHGGRAVVNTCEGKADKFNLWAADKKQRCGYNKAAIAVANKNVRIIWAILTTGEDYRYPEWVAEAA